MTAAADEGEWVVVKYRSTPVDVGASRFEHLSGAGSSLVRDAWYDAEEQYLIIDLDGTKYHYCGVPVTEWSAFRSASSLGSHYNSELKGYFDCRTGVVPEYGGAG